MPLHSAHIDSGYISARGPGRVTAVGKHARPLSRLPTALVSLPALLPIQEHTLALNAPAVAG